LKTIHHQSVAALVAVALLAGSLPARAEAPVGRYTINTDTVVDTQTHLTWQRNVTNSTSTWSAANAACQSLVAGGFSSGWRLPTKKELQSIADLTSSPAIDVVAFPNTPTTAFWFWTSTPYIGAAGTRCVR
jgi:hypothetical protein